MPHFPRQPAHAFVPCRRHGHLHPIVALIVGEHRAVAFGGRVQKIVVVGLPPGHARDCGGALQISPGNVSQRIGGRTLRERDVQRFRLQRGGRHALAVSGIEAAQRIAERQQACRQGLELFVVPETIGGIDHARDGRDERRGDQGVVHCGLRQAFREVEKRGRGFRGIVAGAAAERTEVAPAFDRQQHRAARAHPRQIAQGQGLPCPWLGRIEFDDCTGIAEVDFDFLDRWQREAQRAEPAQTRFAPAGRIDDAVGLHRPASGVIHDDARHAIGGRVIGQAAHGRARMHLEIRCSAGYTLADAVLQQPAALAVQQHAVVAARGETKFGGGGEVASFERHRAVRRERREEARHQPIDGVLAALQQHVHVMRLGRHASRLGNGGELIAFQHLHDIEVRGGDARGEHAADAAADDDGAPAEQRRCRHACGPPAAAQITPLCAVR